jgi:hypothetical protein
MAIIQTDDLEQKINTFIQENHITPLKKDPTETFQKRIKQALQTMQLAGRKRQIEITYRYKT